MNNYDYYYYYYIDIIIIMITWLGRILAHFTLWRLHDWLGYIDIDNIGVKRVYMILVET